MSQENRRRFLQFLAASPLAGSAGYGWAQLLPKSRVSDPAMWAPMRADELIKSPKEAINVFDFEPVCRENVPPAHFGYMASGIDDEVTLRANREDFLKLQLRPRRLVDVSKVDMSTEILGVKYPTPIVIAPVGGQKAFHPEGEIAVARAAKAGNHLQILSTSTTSAVEHGMDGIIVSNHGARSEDSGRSAIDALPEIVGAVKGRMPVLVDSGFRRGTDIAKGLALGAQAVCIGRPHIWGLGAFGQPGVERVMELLRLELYAAMQQMGAPSVRQLVPAMVRKA